MVSLVEKRDLQGYLKRSAYVASSPINDSVLGGSFDNSAVLDSHLFEWASQNEESVCKRPLKHFPLHDDSTGSEETMQSDLCVAPSCADSDEWIHILAK